MAPLSLHKFEPQCFILTIMKAYSLVFPLLYYLSFNSPSILRNQCCFQNTQRNRSLPCLKTFQCLHIKWVSPLGIKGLSVRLHPTIWSHLSPLPINISSALSIGSALFCPKYITIFSLPSHLVSYHSLYLECLPSQVPTHLSRPNSKVTSSVKPFLSIEAVYIA